METNTETPAAVFQGLPLRGLEPTDTIQTGDLCLDVQGGWLPFVGPIGMPVSEWIGDHLRQFARLLPAFMEEGWELRGMHERITALSDELLINVGDAWTWRRADHAEIPIGWMPLSVYLIPEVLAIRRRIVPQEGTPRRPIAEWMSHELQELMRTNITDVLVRGLVRRNHQLVIPMDIFNTGDRERIVQWLEEERARTHVETVQYVRVYQARRQRLRDELLRTPVAVPATPGGINWTVIGTAPTPPADMVTIEYVARIRRTTTDERFDRIRYAVNVPRTVFDQGEGRVEQYCYEEYREGNYDRIEMVEEGDWNQIEEDTEIRDVQTTNYEDVLQTLNPVAVEEGPQIEQDPFEEEETEENQN